MKSIGNRGMFQVKLVKLWQQSSGVFFYAFFIVIIFCAIRTAFSAAPLSNWSPLTNSSSPLGAKISDSLILPTSTSKDSVAVSGMGYRFIDGSSTTRTPGAFFSRALDLVMEINFNY